MGANAYQIDATVTLKRPTEGSDQVGGLGFHYVYAGPWLGNEEDTDFHSPPGYNAPLRVSHEFYAYAFDGTHDRNDPLASSFEESSPGVFKVRLTPVGVSTRSSSEPAMPEIQPGRYRLASLQIFSLSNNQYFAPEEGFPGSDVTIPDTDKDDSRAFKIVSVAAEGNRVSII